MASSSASVRSRARVVPLGAAARACAAAAVGTAVASAGTAAAASPADSMKCRRVISVMMLILDAAFVKPVSDSVPLQRQVAPEQPYPPVAEEPEPVRVPGSGS